MWKILATDCAACQLDILTLDEKNATMSKFQLFDAVNLTSEIALTEGGVAPAGTAAAIIEVFNDGEAYMVELFGGWVKAEVGSDFVPAAENEPGAFMETIGVETVYPHQLKLAQPEREIMGEYQRTA